MWSVTFTGFETKEQARCFADWYEGQGEQDAAYWLEENSDLAFASWDTSVPFKIKDNSITVTLRLYYKEKEE